MDASLIPTGELRQVEDTPFDFRTGRQIGDRIDDTDEEVGPGSGYYHNFVISRSAEGMEEIAAVRDLGCGRVMIVSSKEPGVQFYTGNFLGGSIKGKVNTTYGKRSGLCLEIQHFPDSPNQPAFPSTLL